MNIKLAEVELKLDGKVFKGARRECWLMDTPEIYGICSGKLSIFVAPNPAVPWFVFGCEGHREELESERLGWKKYE